MLRNFQNWLSRHKNQLPLWTVILVCLIVTGTSYKWGTYLSGWDTLHPEFNLGLYAERVIFGAWQEHQGLGAPASQAHVAELPRLLLLFIFDLLLPQSAVRYAMFYFLYFVGVTGVYFFIKTAWFEDEKDNWHAWASALGALFFGLNLGTLQHFYVPLEMFAVHFATLPWLLLVTWKYLKTFKRKYLLWFFAIQVLSSPSAHTATLFYMYTAVIFLFILVFSILKYWKNKKRAIKPILQLFFLTLTAHSYWMIPNLYYILFHSDYVQNAKISRHFSTEAFWQNQAYGSLSNIVIFKNFLFNWKDFDFATSKFIPLFDEWENHLKTIIGYPLLFLSAILYLTGLGSSIKNFRKKNVEKLALLVLFFVPFFFLNNLNFPSETLFGLMFRLSDTFREALRFPFTKFSILFIFAASVYFAQFFSFTKTVILKFIPTKNQLSYKYLIIIFGLALLFLPNFPAFRGNLVSPSMKIEYPKYYFEMFEWFGEQQREGRIVKLPIIDFFGWTYQRWPTNINQGYQGAGFIWFGLPQPILDREFDRWVDKNEFFYNEIASAIKNNNQKYFHQILEKYQVNWLLFDKTTIDPDKASSDFYAQFTKLINSDKSITLANTFGPIEIYKFSTVNDNWLISDRLVKTNSNLDNLKNDPILEKFGSYTNSPESESQISYPFADLLKEETSLPFTMSETEISVDRPTRGKYNNLVIPAMENYVESIPVNIWIKMNAEGSVEFTLESLLPEINIGDKSIKGSSLATSESITIQGSIDNLKDKYIFALNDTFVFFSLTEEKQFLGSFILPTKGVELSLYEAQPSEYFSFLETTDLSINNCQNGEQEPELLSLEKTRNGIKISAKNRIACISDAVFKNIPTSGLLSVYFDYQSETKNTNTRICIFEKDGTGCLNSDSDYTFFAQKDSRQARVFETIDNPTNFNISFNLDGSDAEKQLSYNNAGAEFHPLAISLSASGQDLSKILPNKTVLSLEDNVENISIKQNFDKESELISLKPMTSLSNNANCGNLSGKVGFEVTENGHVLSSENKGVACESFDFNQLNSLQDYVLLTTTTNHRGRELRLVLSDYKNLIFQEIYAPNNKVTKNILISNPRQENGLKVEFLGDSFGKYKSINEINQLALAPFPLDWAANINLIKNNITETPKLNILEQKRYFNFLYSAEVNNPDQKSGVLQLSQSYDSLWLAYEVTNPFHYFKHTKINNWANGWEIPTGNHKIIIFYLPQISIFVGLTLLLASAIGVHIYIKNEPKRNIFQKLLDTLKGKTS